MIYITRADVENENYEAEDGVLVFLTEEGVPSSRYVRNQAGKIILDDMLPPKRKRYPYDKKNNEYQLGSL